MSCVAELLWPSSIVMSHVAELTSWGRADLFWPISLVMSCVAELFWPSLVGMSYAAELSRDELTSAGRAQLG